MHATAELDLTDFGDCDTFLALVNKHDLRYGGIRTDEHVTPYHEWASMNTTNLVLRTICNPVDGEHLLSGRSRDPGCASYCTIIGEVPAAKELLRDILQVAHVKGGGIDRPLTSGDGIVFPVETD